MRKFKVFKEIKIGGMSKESLLLLLEKHEVQFNMYAHSLIQSKDFSPCEIMKTVRLVKVTLNDLGLSKTCSLDEFFTTIKTMGLQVCPLYLAAFLRLEYLDQREGPYLTVVSKQIPGLPNGFYLRNTKGKLWLRGYRADGFDNWPENNEFVLMF